MNAHLQSLLDILSAQESLDSDAKEEFNRLVKKLDKEITILEFKLDRTEKVKRTTSVLLEETIEELEQKRKAVEEQHRELEIEAALDRVRAKIASMRTAQDLERITPLIWAELITMGVPFFRCGIFIIDEKSKNCQVLLSTPTGTSLAALDLPFGTSDFLDAAVQSWRKVEIFKQVWNKTQFVEWMQSIIDGGFLDNPEHYIVNKEAPESLALHFVPFSQGMLYVGSKKLLTDEHLDLVRSLADTFSVAYARYEDFIQLEKAKTNLEVTLNDLKATQTQLIHAEKMASLGELTAGIAHEIQNPLNFVNNFSEINTELIEEMNEAIAESNYEEVRTIANDIAENEKKVVYHGKRADAIVKGMLQHSRSSEKSKAPTDINALADEYLRLAYHGLRAKDKSFNADFTTDLDPDLPKVDIISQDIGRVLLNLISNAFYAVHEKKQTQGVDYQPMVNVSTRETDKGVEVLVKDNGGGIPEEVLSKIFQPFFTTKPAGSGTGLGLSISYDIINAHGGKLEVYSSNKEYTQFTIFLPKKT